MGTRSPGVSTRGALLFRLERIHARPARRLGTVSFVDLAAFVRARIDACVTHSVMGAPRFRCSRASSSRAALSFPSSMAPPRVQSRSMGSSSCALRSPSFPLSPPDEPDTSPFKPFGRAGSNRGVDRGGRRKRPGTRQGDSSLSLQVTRCMPGAWEGERTRAPSIAAESMDVGSSKREGCSLEKGSEQGSTTPLPRRGR